MSVPAPTTRRVWKFLQFPVTRIVLGFMVIGVAVSFGQAVAQSLPGSDTLMVSLLSGSAVALLAIFAYAGFVRLIEKRPVSEVALSRALAELGSGALVGAVLFTVTIGVLWALGYYHVAGLNHWTSVMPMLTVAIISGVVEELLIRGVLFRITEEALGTWLALLISALLFGLLHLANPNATVWGALAIALEAGVLLAAAFVVTRRLWLPIGIHFAWNFFQGGIFGVAVSGTAAPGLLQSTLNGPALLSGGEFGAEASVVAVVICLAAGLYFVWKALKQGNFVKPFWKR